LAVAPFHEFRTLRSEEPTSPTFLDAAPFQPISAKKVAATVQGVPAKRIGVQYWLHYGFA
jgi:hypothetical protein